MIHRSLPVAALALAALAACTPARPSAAPVADAATEREVRAVTDQWASAYNRDDVPGVTNTYAPDGVHVSGTARYEGAAAIQRMIAESVPVSTNFGLSDREITVRGDLAVETGLATQDVTAASGQRYRVTGDYLAVLTRQPDGTWKIQTLMTGNRRQQQL